MESGFEISRSKYWNDPYEDCYNALRGNILSRFIRHISDKEIIVFKYKLVYLRFVKNIGNMGFILIFI
jgi:hypothetical protein